MKKIMFNDKYGLTQAVLEGRKTMTRRGIKWDMFCGMREDSIDFAVSTKVLLDGRQVFTAFDVAGSPIGQVVSAYHVGEEVAVAQKYKDCWDIYQRRWEAKKDPSDWHTPDAILGDQVDTVKGWSNKMFVRAGLMPHCIRTANIRVERLQDISDEDCLKEGIYKNDNPPRWRPFDPYEPWHPSVNPYKFGFATAKGAFAFLIDKVSGKGTWKRDPWVFAYSFELIK